MTKGELEHLLSMKEANTLLKASIAALAVRNGLTGPEKVGAQLVVDRLNKMYGEHPEAAKP